MLSCHTVFTQGEHLWRIKYGNIYETVRSDRQSFGIGIYVSEAYCRANSITGKGLYRIATSKGEKLAEVSGKFRYGAVTVSDYPVVGDFVMADWNNAGGNARTGHVGQFFWY